MRQRPGPPSGMSPPGGGRAEHREDRQPGVRARLDRQQPRGVLPRTRRGDRRLARIRPSRPRPRRRGGRRHPARRHRRRGPGHRDAARSQEPPHRRLRPLLPSTEVRVPPLRTRRPGPQPGGPGLPRPSRRGGARLHGTSSGMDPPGQGRGPPGEKLEVDLRRVPAPHLPRERPAPPHPRRDRQHGPQPRRHMDDPRRPSRLPTLEGRRPSTKPSCADCSPCASASSGGR